MSFNWIQLIGLLLVSSQIAGNKAIIFSINNHDHEIEVLRTKTINCKHDTSYGFRSDYKDRFNQIQILTSFEPSTCRLLFSGHTDEEVHIFLNNDVQLATTHINNSLACGSLKFEETNRSVNSYFCTPSQQIEDLNHKLKEVYYSSSENLTLSINNSPKSNDSSILNIYYRFVTRTKAEVSETIEFLDLKRKQLVCDHLFKQCNSPAHCVKLYKQSLNASHFTCDYLIRHQNQSANNRIIISQVNKQKKTIYASNTSLDCLNFIEFYEGNTQMKEKLITKLCSPILQMPLVRTNSDELLVVYRLNKLSADDELELIVEMENRKIRTTRVAERNKKSLPFDMESCNVHYNATTTSQRSGQIVFKNQLQDQPKDLPCFIHLSSSNPFDRIWFYFLSYRPASLLNTNSLSSNQFPPTDSCKITELKLFDTSEQLYTNNVNNFSNKGKSFCGTSQPRICNPNRQQCFLPSESYLSTGSKLSLMAVNKINPSLYLLPLQFTLNYEMINTQEYGEAVPNTICDRLFDSTRYRHGTVRSSRNLFLFGRGGRQNLNCGYIFRGQANQRLRIQLYRIKVKSTDCVQQRELNSGANKCVSTNVRTNGPSSRFSVWDDVLSDVNSTNSTNEDNNQIRIPVDCFCNKTVNFLTPVSFHLIGGQATLNFTIENMRPTDDFNDYAFEAFYEFLSTSNDLSQHTLPFEQLEPTRPVQVKTNPPRNYSMTTYQLTVPSNYSFDYYQEFKQRKRLIAKERESVLINVPNGFLWKNSALRTCSQLSRLVVYWIVPTSSIVDNNHAIATICIEPYRTDQTAGLDSLSTMNSNNKLSPLIPDQMQLSFEFDHHDSNQPNSNTYLSDHSNNQFNQLLNTRTLRFYANRTVKRIDLVIELIATSKGQFRFDWLQSTSKQAQFDEESKFHSSMRTSELNQSIKQFKLNDKSDKSNDNLNNKSSNKLNSNPDNSTLCLAYCPEDGLCLKQEYLCDQISHCTTSGFDESPLICEAKEQNRLEHFLSIIQTENGGKIDKITSNESLFKNNWFILFSSTIFLFTFALVAYLIIHLRRRSKHHQSIPSNNFPSALQIGGCNSIHTGTLQTGSASSTFSGNSSLTNSSCTNSMLCEKRLKKLKQKIANKEQSKHAKQSANALTLIRSSLEDNNFNPLISSFGNNSTTIHQQIHQQINGNQQPADYVSTSEFQFELNHDRLNNYDLDKQANDFSPLCKKIESDEYSLKQHIYYQPAYTTLQRNNRLDNNSRTIQEQQRIDSRLDYRLDQRIVDKPPLPPLPLVLQNAQHTQQQPSSLLSYHSAVNNCNESHHEAFGLRSQLNTSHLTNLNNHHTIARQSLLADQAERLLMSTPIYDRVVDRQQFNNNASSMHRSALFASSRFANRRFS